MTLFRHFPTKESLILQDPFDPAIAEAVEKRPAKEAPLHAITAGIQSLLDTFTPDVEEQLRTRLRIVADNPELAAAAIHSNDETITAIATALTSRGVDKLTATAVATAHCWTDQGVNRLEYAHQSAAHADVARCFTCFRGCLTFLSYATLRRQAAALLNSIFRWRQAKSSRSSAATAPAKPHCYGSRLASSTPPPARFTAPWAMAILGSLSTRRFAIPS